MQGALEMIGGYNKTADSLYSRKRREITQEIERIMRKYGLVSPSTVAALTLFLKVK